MQNHQPNILNQQNAFPPVQQQQFVNQQQQNQLQQNQPSVQQFQQTHQQNQMQQQKYQPQSIVTKPQTPVQSAPQLQNVTKSNVVQKPVVLNSKQENKSNENEKSPKIFQQLFSKIKISEQSDPDAKFECLSKVISYQASKIRRLEDRLLKIESIIPVYGSFDDQKPIASEPTKTNKKRKLEEINQQQKTTEVTEQIDNILLSSEEKK
eukprot:gene839-9088_t